MKITASPKSPNVLPTEKIYVRTKFSNEEEAISHTKDDKFGKHGFSYEITELEHTMNKKPKDPRTPKERAIEVFLAGFTDLEKIVLGAYVSKKSSK